MRLKKSLFALFFLCACFGAFSEAGVGGAFSYSPSTTPTSFVSFTARSDVSPWCVFLNGHLEKKTLSLFVDNWFINERISEHVDYYVLWGIGAGVTFDDGKRMIATGSRLGAGLDFFFLERRLEFFTQAVFEPYYGIKKNRDENWKPFIRPVNFPCSAGIRVWF